MVFILYKNKCYIGRNQIGDEGAKAIAEAIKGNETLRILNLGIYSAFAFSISIILRYRYQYNNGIAFLIR